MKPSDDKYNSVLYYMSYTLLFLSLQLFTFLPDEEVLGLACQLNLQI